MQLTNADAFSALSGPLLENISKIPTIRAGQEFLGNAETFFSFTPGRDQSALYDDDDHDDDDDDVVTGPTLLLTHSLESALL